MLIDALNKNQIINELVLLAQKNGANEATLFEFLTKKTEKISQRLIFNDKFVLDDVKSIFKFESEEVCVKDFENGSRPDLGFNLIDSMAQVGRNAQVVNLIKAFDFAKFEQSLKADHIQLFEINGKYFLDNDGNHRMLALKFLYYLEMAKPNAIKEEIDKKFTFTFPVKHLNHNPLLIETALKISQKQKPSKFPDEYFANSNTETTQNGVLKYNKENKTYGINFQGLLKNNLTESAAISLLQKFESHQAPYIIHNLKNGYAFEAGNVLTVGLTKEQVMHKIDNFDVSKLNNPNDYLIVKKDENNYDLIVSTKTFYANEEDVLKMYSSVVAANNGNQNEELKILTKFEATKMFLKNLSYADFQLKGNESWIKIVGKEQKNISKQELIAAIKKLSFERQFCPVQNTENNTLENIL